MKRSWNWRVWLGFAIALFAALSYLPIFARFPLTRDIPWVNLLLFVAAGYVLGAGVYRAFAQSNRYRGKISGGILGALALGVLAFFCYGVFFAARDIPSGRSALRAGQQAPEFKLAGIDGNPVTLAQVLEGHRAVLLIFYRGYW